MHTASAAPTIPAIDHSRPGDGELAAAYARDGYVSGGELLDAATVERLRAELARVIADDGRAGVAPPYRVMNIGGPAPVWQIVNIWQGSADFAALLRHPRILALAGRLSGARSLRIWHDQIQYKPAGIGGVNMWHQDAPYWGPLAPQDQQITAWIALADADADNGCMSMVPGSHRWGDAIGFLHGLPAFDAMPARYLDHDLRVALRPVPVGHVHFHHSLTWHGSHANPSGRPRRAIALHFMSERTVRQSDRHHPLRDEIASRSGNRCAESVSRVVVGLTPAPGLSHRHSCGAGSGQQGGVEMPLRFQPKSLGINQTSPFAERLRMVSFPSPW